MGGQCLLADSRPANQTLVTYLCRVLMTEIYLWRRGAGLFAFLGSEKNREGDPAVRAPVSVT